MQTNVLPLTEYKKPFKKLSNYEVDRVQWCHLDFILYFLTSCMEMDR
jgi:hypothetical protein